MTRLLPLLLLVAGCGASHQPVRPRPEAPTPTPVDAKVADDPALTALVGGYKAQLGERLGVRLVQADAEISPSGDPSNPLGVLVADLMLEALRALPGPRVDCFITNDGGLRVPLYAGTVELRHVYEAMPFDNELVVLELDGATLQKVADRIASKGGEPVSGLRMVIAPEAGVATEVQVDGRPLDPKAIYRVGTSDYLSEAGWMSELVKGRPSARVGLLMRDAIAARLKVRGDAGQHIAPAVDDRIRLATESGGKR